MENLVFTQLSVPEIRLLFRQELETYFSTKESNNNQPEPERWLNLADLCEYLPEKPVKDTVYGWVHKRLIPFNKKGKKLYFLKSEVDAWLKTGRKKTIAETEQEAQEFTNPKRK